MPDPPFVTAVDVLSPGETVVVNVPSDAPVTGGEASMVTNTARRFEIKSIDISGKTPVGGPRKA